MGFDECYLGKTNCPITLRPPLEDKMKQFDEVKKAIKILKDHELLTNSAHKRMLKQFKLLMAAYGIERKVE